MSRTKYLAALGLVAAVSIVFGMLLASGPLRSPGARTPDVWSPALAAPPPPPEVAPGAQVGSFADVAERANPTVVSVSNVEFRKAGFEDPFRFFFGPRGHGQRGRPGQGEDQGQGQNPGQGEDDEQRYESGGSGFVISEDGYILTNNHVVANASKLQVTMENGEKYEAKLVGKDESIDLALIKITPTHKLLTLPLGDSDALRVGEWVIAIGNPLGYEHTVTVGVVSYIGRKLFDTSLDHYIQTDAAISFGNSGGPLINGRGEVVGINAAISSRANSIGFAVPMNTATTILPQLRAHGRVARGYIGVALKDVNPDLERSLGLTVHRGALVQDLTQGSPGQRAGIRPYDVIVSVDDDPVDTGEDLIRRISTRAPGSAASLRLVRDGHEQTVVVKLAERPARDWAGRRREPVSPPAAERRSDSEGLLGLTVRDMDRQTAERMRLPNALQGVLIARVEAVSPAFDAAVERGTVLLEMNRQRVETAADYRRIARAARPGDIVTLYVYSPDLEQRQLKTIRVEGR